MQSRELESGSERDEASEARNQTGIVAGNQSDIKNKGSLTSTIRKIKLASIMVQIKERLVPTGFHLDERSYGLYEFKQDVPFSQIQIVHRNWYAQWFEFVRRRSKGDTLAIKISSIDFIIAIVCIGVLVEALEVYVCSCCKFVRFILVRKRLVRWSFDVGWFACELIDWTDDLWWQSENMCNGLISDRVHVCHGA